MQLNNQLILNISPSNHSIIKLSWTQNQRQFVIQTTKHCFFKPSFNLSLPLSKGQNIMWHHSDTSLLRLVLFQKGESLRSSVFLLSRSSEQRILISYFPRDHKAPWRQVLLTQTRSRPRKATRQFTGTAESWATYRSGGNHQSQPTFEMLWTSWTCCCCKMLGWPKYPRAFAEMFPAQWSFGERRESKRTFSVILNVLDHYLRTAHTLL